MRGEGLLCCLGFKDSAPSGGAMSRLQAELQRGSFLPAYEKSHHFMKANTNM